MIKSLDWKLIFLLSLFGLVMAVATVWVIPSQIEPLFWLAIFIICAVIIAKRAPARFFLHGLCVSLVNCVWITSAHIIFFDAYVANHPQEAAMMSSMPMPESPRLMMAMTGTLIGFVSGVVLGLFAFVAAKIVKRRGA